MFDRDEYLGMAIGFALVVAFFAINLIIFHYSWKEYIMSYTFNNKRLLNYNLWCDDNDDELYCIYMESGAYYEQDSDDFYKDLYDKELDILHHRLYKEDIKGTYLDPNSINYVVPICPTDQHSWKEYTMSKAQAIQATLAKYPTMSVASATYYVIEVLGYSEHS